MKPRTEAELHKAIIVLAKLMAVDRALPERRVKLLLLYHIPNGVKPQGAGRNSAARLGALEKALGVRRGMPDLHLPVASYRQPEQFRPVVRGENISLYGEVKLPNVKVPDYQRVIHEELRADGNRVDIWRSVDDAMKSFREHLAL